MAKVVSLELARFAAEMKHRREAGPEWWALDENKVPYKSTIEQFAATQAEHHHVAADMVGETFVSTIFAGVEMGGALRIFRPETPPVLFETMAFTETGENIEQRRYATWEAALKGHEEVVAVMVASEGGARRSL